MRKTKRDAGVEKLLRWAGEWKEELKYYAGYGEWTPEIAAKQERYERILQEIEKLPFRDRQIIREHYIAGQTFVWISVRIGKSEAWCRQRRDAAFEVLKILLRDVLEAS